MDSPIYNLAGDPVAWNEYSWNGYNVNYARVVSIDNNGVETPLIFSYDDDGTLKNTGASVVQMGVNMPLYAALDDTSHSFAIELGHWENDTWTTLATSVSYGYSELQNVGYTYAPSGGEMALVNLTAWAPTSYAVPEPSSGLLLLIGASLLALKRRLR